MLHHRLCHGGRAAAHVCHHTQLKLDKFYRMGKLKEKAEQEKLASVIRAEGDAEAAMKISEAIRRNGTGLIEVRQIDAAKDVAALAARSRGNITYLPSNSSSSGSSSGSSGILLNVDGK